jgi:hypothetical protein
MHYFSTLFITAVLTAATSCTPAPPSCDYLKNEETGIKSGGIRLILLEGGKYKVWTKRIGNNPKINQTIYVSMQGPSEFGISGKLERWDVVSRLPELKVPSLVIGATHDTMDPAHMKMVSEKVQKGRFLLCPEGSHMCMWDDQAHYFPGLISFLKDVDSGKM